MKHETNIAISYEASGTRKLRNWKRGKSHDGFHPQSVSPASLKCSWGATFGVPTLPWHLRVIKMEDASLLMWISRVVREEKEKRGFPNQRFTFFLIYVYLLLITSLIRFILHVLITSPQVGRSTRTDFFYDSPSAITVVWNRFLSTSTLVVINSHQITWESSHGVRERATCYVLEI